jgi:hypothetical protein
LTYRGICRIKEDNLQPGTFYARVIVGETRDLETMIPNIVAKTALSGTDVKAVIDALTAEVIAALAHQAGTTGRTGHQCPGYRTTPRERGWTLSATSAKRCKTSALLRQITMIAFPGTLQRI